MCPQCHQIKFFLNECITSNVSKWVFLFLSKHFPWEHKIYFTSNSIAQACWEVHFCASDFRARLHIASEKVNQYFLSITFFFFFIPKVLLSCMTNPFYLAGSASNIFRLFPKIKSTLKRRGHVNSDDESRNVLEALKTNLKGKLTNYFGFVHNLPGIWLLWRK